MPPRKPADEVAPTTSPDLQAWLDAEAEWKAASTAGEPTAEVVDGGSDPASATTDEPAVDPVTCSPLVPTARFEHGNAPFLP